MLKGKAEIILTNKDGSEQRFEETNMFTNAIKNIIEFQSTMQYFVRNSSHDEIFAPFTPIYKNMLGGVLLFENEIPENAEQVLPPAGNRNVGYADDQAHAVDTNLLLGSYNSYESGATDDGKGYKHVWEFNTSQANGKISCICLTSRIGGSSGWDSADSPTYPKFLDGTKGISGNLTSWDYFSCNLKAKVGDVIFDMEDTDTEVVFRGFNVDYNSKKIVIYRYAKKKSIGLVETYPNIGVQTTEINLMGFWDCYDIRSYNVGVNRAEKTLSYSDCNYYGDGEEYIVTINYETNDIVKTNIGKILPGDYYAYSCTIVTNGVAYILYKTSVYKIDVITKELLGTVELPTECIRMIMESDTIIVTENGGDAKCYIISMSDFTLTGNVRRYFGNIYPNIVSSPKAPIILGAELIYEQTNVYPLVITPYLATINNLSTPITKTNEQTLKVIYTITEE